MRSSARCTKSAEHCVSEPERRRLADVDTGGVRGQHAAQLVEQVALALLLQHELELLVGVEVVLDGALGGTGDEHQALRAGSERFLDRILDKWLVDHRQHLFRACLGRRQEARAAARHRKHRGADRRSRRGPHCILSSASCRHEARTARSARSAHLKMFGRRLSQAWHLGQCQYQRTLLSPQSLHW